MMNPSAMVMGIWMMSVIFWISSCGRIRICPTVATGTILTDQEKANITPVLTLPGMVMSTSWISSRGRIVTSVILRSIPIATRTNRGRLRDFKKGEIDKEDGFWLLSFDDKLLVRNEIFEG
jgi:hypothetical protein